MLPADYPLSIYQGDDRSLTVRIRVKNEDGTLGAYIVLTGSTPSAQIRATADATVVLATFACTVTDQTVYPGQVILTLTAIQTAALPVGYSIWDFQVADSGGHIQTYLRGTVTVVAEVTRP